MSPFPSLFHLEPESIPFPLSRVYAAITGLSIFKLFYEMVATQVCKRLQAGRVLDIGTGPGTLPIIIASRNLLLRVTGLDLSGDMVKIATRNAARAGVRNVDFRQGSASSLPFADGEFSLVISTLSFHHWREPRQALDEVYRVLREGGEAWIYDVPRKMSREMFDELKHSHGFIEAWLFRLHAYTEPFYTEMQIAEIATESRFKKYEITHTGMTYRLILYK